MIFSYSIANSISEEVLLDPVYISILNFFLLQDLKVQIFSAFLPTSQNETARIIRQGQGKSVISVLDTTKSTSEVAAVRVVSVAVIKPT